MTTSSEHGTLKIDEINAGSNGSNVVSRIGQFINKRIYFVLIFPSFFFYTTFWIIPMLMATGISLTKWTGMGLATMKWVGLKNFSKLVNDKFFWKALTNNFIMVVGTVVFMVGVALVLAIILDTKPKGHALFTTVFFMPTVLSMIVIGLIFMLMLSPAVGLVNPIFGRLGLTSLQNVQWLGDKRTALGSVLAVFVWRGFGFSMLLFLAGLQNIPRNLVEAAKIDGATPLQLIFYVTLPMLQEVSIVVIILAVSSAFLVFDLILAMTWGGPFHASEVLATYMYHQAFTKGKMGYGTAIAVVLFFIVMIVTIIQLRLTKSGTREY